VSFDRIAMQPGMPQGFGTLGAGETPFFGLPGNPVSALVSFEIFVRPAIRLMLGKNRLFRRSLEATATEDFDSPAEKRQYRRGLLHREDDGSYGVTPVGGPGSHLLASMAQANCLIVTDEETTKVSRGNTVTVLPILPAGS
jgi:molybdopterin molybdotransferase